MIPSGGGMAPKFISREANNLREPRWTPGTLNPKGVKTLTVHHSAGPVNQPWRDIQWAAMSEKNDFGQWVYPDAHYHHGVDEAGVHILRGLTTKGGHDGVNDGWGICVKGNWSSKLPPDKTLRNLVELVAWLEDQAGRELTFLGHRDRMATACPGSKLYGWVKNDLRGAVRALNDTPTPQVPPKPKSDLAEALDPISNTKKGDSGTQVKLDQGLLLGWGYNLGAFGPKGNGIDGRAGNYFDRAVKAFQKAKGLAQTGEIDSRTRAELIRA